MLNYSYNHETHALSFAFKPDDFNVVAHVFRHYNLAIILIFAVQELSLCYCYTWLWNGKFLPLIRFWLNYTLLL